jgi:hypothetical protein
VDVERGEKPIGCEFGVEDATAAEVFVGVDDSH